MATQLIELDDETLVEIEVPEGQVQQISGGFFKRVNASFANIEPLILKTCRPIATAWKNLREELGQEIAINQAGEPQKLAMAFTELRCTFNGRFIVPDISVFAWQRIPIKPNGRIENRFEIAPDWVIEILSPDQSSNQLINKILFCLNNGTQLGW